MGIGQDGTDVCEFFFRSREGEGQELTTEKRQQHIFPRFNSDLPVKRLFLSSIQAAPIRGFPPTSVCQQHANFTQLSHPATRLH